MDNSDDYCGLLLSSNLFNPSWYRETYSLYDLSEEELAKHYVQVGWRNG